MRLQEYQAKDVLSKTGIPIPPGGTAATPEEAGEVFDGLSAALAVVKAQVLTGGRGKAGGIKTAHSREESVKAASELLSRRLVTAQSGPEGMPVRKVLVEEGLAVEQEYYLAIAVDRAAGKPVVIVSSSGGMEIEEAARKRPGSVVREYIEPVFGLQPFQARKLAYAIGVSREDVNRFVDVMLKLHVVFLVSDAELVEINPMVKVEEGAFVALDAKMTVDDGALFRHDDLRKLADPADIDPLEFEARQAGINYVKLSGNIGCMVNGAGLAMATMDLIKNFGGEPANFLDVGGGAGAEQVKKALQILVSDSQVEAVLINIFGGILRCDVLAEGIVAAARSLPGTPPMVVRLEGTNKDEGARILKESGLGITFAHTMREAGETAVHMLRSNA